MDAIINNGWFIAVVSVIPTFGITLCLHQLRDWLRSRRGALTGIYLSLSPPDALGSGIAEIIRCKNAGSRLEATSLLCRDFSSGASGEIHLTSRGNFEYEGRIRESRVTLSYWDPAPASVHGGTMTMLKDVDGWTFRGSWCGTSETGRTIAHGPCRWIRVDDVRKNPSDEDLRREIQKQIAAVRRLSANAPGQIHATTLPDA